MTLPKVSWTVAKTYPDAPHEYVIRGRVPMDFFDYYAEKIKTQGVLEEFTLRGRTSRYRYWYGPDGYRYWRVGAAIINRARF